MPIVGLNRSRITLYLQGFLQLSMDNLCLSRFARLRFFKIAARFLTVFFKPPSRPSATANGFLELMPECNSKAVWIASKIIC